MIESVEIVRAETSERYKLPKSVPYLKLRLNGSSYLNAKAASLLNIKNGDTVSFFHKTDLSEWWISNDPIGGAVIRKSGGRFEFCDLANIRKLFGAFGINGNQADIPLSPKLVEIGSSTEGLFIIPKPMNIL